jgi:hypothetical protein
MPYRTLAGLETKQLKKLIGAMRLKCFEGKKGDSGVLRPQGGPDFRAASSVTREPLTLRKNNDMRLDRCPEAARDRPAARCANSGLRRSASVRIFDDRMALPLWSFPV